MSQKKKKQQDRGEEEEDLVPRDYQILLCEIALRENTIIYLPTGAGKTFVALMLIKRMGKDIEKPICEGGKVTVFLVNAVALVTQHADYLLRHTPFTVGTFSGDMNVDNWNHQMWREQINKYQVLVMTAQIMVNIVEAAFISLNNVNLIIFDECHRGVNDHSMRQMMKQFELVYNAPRVLGLTATLINKNVKPDGVKDEVRALETSFHSKIATVEEMNHVIGYSTNPSESIIKFKKHNPTSTEVEALSCLDDFITSLKCMVIQRDPIKPPQTSLRLLMPVNDFKPLINLLIDLKVHIEMLGMFGGLMAVNAYIVQLERVKRNCPDLMIVEVLESATSILTYIASKLSNRIGQLSVVDQVLRFSSDQVVCLVEAVLEAVKGDKPLCALIFVQRRFTAKILYFILQSLKESVPAFSKINPNFVVGFHSDPYNQTREGMYISKMNRKVISDFIERKVNLMIASNVLEEGIDVPTCTLVVRFDKPLDYRAYIQSKGRARHKESTFKVFVRDDEFDSFSDRYQMFQQVEKTLIDLLVGSNELRSGPTYKDIQDLYDEDQYPPYFANGPNSAKITLVSAISRLCMYCQFLPTASYTSSDPMWWYKQDPGTGQYQVVIELPLASQVLQPIEGPLMATRKLAKRAAALQACKVLHQLKELDGNLLPAKRVPLHVENSEYFNFWPVEPEKQAGTTKFRRSHQVHTPIYCRGEIKPNQVVHIHIITFHPQFNCTDTQHMYSSNLCFGLVSAHPFPKICKFPLYISAGEIIVDLQVNQDTFLLTDQDILSIKEFHHVVFSDLLRVLKDFLVFGKGEGCDNVLVLPVNKSKERLIDFEILRKNKSLRDQKKRPSVVEDIDGYLGKIVSPWYRAEEKQYLVVDVCYGLTSNSLFPTAQFGSFANYFRDKYNCYITQPDQPLLQVKALSQRLNCLKPRGQPKRARDNWENKEDSDFTEHLPPELCVRQEFPAELWIQALLLPSLLHRVQHFLHADELRLTIERECGFLEARSLGPLGLDQSALEERPNLDVSEHVAELEGACQELAPPIKANEEFLAKKLENEYPWAEADEPVDIDRALHVTLMDIQMYEQFINVTVPVEQRILTKQAVPAITYSLGPFVHKGIRLLHNKSNNSPELSEIYKALTTLKANDIVNFERLETLGDTLLKLITSLHIYIEFPEFDEGTATETKGTIVSNKNLFYCAVSKDLGGFMRNADLSPRAEWMPPSYCLPEVIKKRITARELDASAVFELKFEKNEQITSTLSPQSATKVETLTKLTDPEQDSSHESICMFLGLQVLPDKSIADCVEALLGAYIKSCGIHAGLKLMEWFHILPASKNIANLFSSKMHNPIRNPTARDRDVDKLLASGLQLQKILHYQFKNRAYLLQALTHPSFISNRVTYSYETLEFLGDAVLDFLITCFIYENCGELSPGDLTDLRSALVNNVTFAGYTVRLGLHKFLMYSSGKLQNSIDSFVEVQESKAHRINDEILILIEENDIQIAEHADVPKALGDVFESLIGAIFLDTGMDLEATWEVIYRIMWEEIHMFSQCVPKNPVKLLYETNGAHPEFQTVTKASSTRVMISLDFMLRGIKKRVYGFGERKTMAKRAASKMALRMLHKPA